MANKVIITGVNGFVGEHVVNTFIDAEYETLGLGHDNNPGERVSSQLSEYIKCNLLDFSSVSRIDLSEVKVIIHLAGLSNVGESFKKALPYINDNVSMTYNLLEHARQQEFKGRAIIVSSAALYSPNQSLPLTEDSLSLENSPYAVGKLGVEHTANYFRLRGIDAVTVRPFNHIGPGQGKGFLLPDLYSQLTEASSSGANSISVGNLATRRDYTDVRDIAKAYLLIATTEKLNYGLYNICTGRSLAGTDILGMLQETMGVTDITPVVDPSNVRPTDIMDIYGNSSRLRDDTGWQPKIDIRQTIKDFVASQK
ncbi:MAG: GDP-mannose 4,6-dehydratase [Candidatus Saccharimonas sp.]